MQNTVREYDTRLDTKRRITLRGASFDYYHVSVFDNGQIVLDPRELTAPFQVSVNTLAMMDESIQNMRTGSVSAVIDLSEFTE